MIRYLKLKWLQVRRSLRKAKTRDKFFALFLLTIWIILISGYFISGNYVFEGNLFVKSLNFTYTGESEKLFLQNIDSLKKIDIQGKLDQPIALSGQFSIVNNPSLQQKIDNLTNQTLTIALPFPESRFIVAEKNNLKTTELSLIDLRIEPETNINQLTYNPSNQSLSLCLTAHNDFLESCQFPQTIKSSRVPIGKLRLDLGQQPLEIQFKQINIPELNIKGDQNNPEEFIFQYIPNQNETINLTLLNPHQLLVSLPKKDDINHSNEWFRKDIDVKNVKFTQYEKTANVTDELKTSSIIKGEVRLGKQKMELQEHQFLIVNSSNSGIKKIRSIQINSPDPQLNSHKFLQTFITGESKGIAVGLYPDFPVESIEPNFLSKHLSSEAINAIIGFITAFTAILLPRLFPESPNN